MNLEGKMRIAIASLMLASACVYADDRGAANGCSNATLKGAYGFTVTGTRPTGPPPAPLEQFVGFAITLFDGEGGLTQPVGSSHGSIASDSPADTGSGTYSLNADCSGTMTLNITSRTPAVLLELWIVVVDGGKQIH